MMSTTQTPTISIVSDALLAEWAALDGPAQCGEFDAQATALLTTALPEICSELLCWRRAAQGRQPAEMLALSWEAIGARLYDARRTVRAPDPIAPEVLKQACDVLLRYSTDAAERSAASDLLAQMQEAA